MPPPKNKKFRFKGLPKYVKKGKVLKVKIRTRQGIVELFPKNSALGFQKNEIIEMPDDDRVRRHHKNSPFFEEVV